MTLIEVFTLCQKSDIFGQFAKTLFYADVPSYFTWKKSDKKWEPEGVPHLSITGIFKANTLGPLYTIHLKLRECFFLYLLLVNVSRPTSFEILQTFNGRVDQHIPRCMSRMSIVGRRQPLGLDTC